MGIHAFFFKGQPLRDSTEIFQQNKGHAFVSSTELFKNKGQRQIFALLKVKNTKPKNFSALRSDSCALFMPLQTSWDKVYYYPLIKKLFSITMDKGHVMGHEY